MIEHMERMQMPYLDIQSILLSGQVPHKTDSSQLFWTGLFQKKNQTGREKGGGGGGEHITFLKKSLEFFLFFSVPLEILVKTKLLPWKFGKIMYEEISRPKTKTSGNLIMNFSWSHLQIHVVFD